MIAALWHRWFDAREYRRAREVAEQNYSQALVREAGLRTENGKLRRANARLAVAAGSDAADADRIEALEERAVNAEKAAAEAGQRVKDLQRQLDEVAAANVKAHRLVDQHAQVSALPPVLTRDREALNRLSADLADARVRIEKCEREHR